MGWKFLAVAMLIAFWMGTTLPAAAQQTAKPCTAPANWFPHSQTPEQDSAGFPENPNNCDFHQWSWNAFLWLTQTVGGEPRFEHMPADGIETKPGVLDALIGRSAKARTLDIIDQAGPNGIMVDLQGHPIYYSIHSDSTFGNFIKRNFINRNDRFDPAKLRKFDANTPFPVGSLTLKAAWKVVAPGEDVNAFYTRKAQIALLTVKNGKIVLSGKTRTVEVALVGFHIGGTVANHPEMIWATFEHVRNAPDVRAMDEMDPDEPVSDENWTFYKADTPFKECNVNDAGAGKLELDKATQTLSPVTEVCRMIPYGGGSNDNIDNIKSLNNSVHAQLHDVWNNYFEVGAIWFAANNGLKPNCTFQPGSSLECPVTPGKPILTGSTQLSNTTIETFTQSQSAQDNCFACHNTLAVTPPNSIAPALPGLDVDISHVLINEYFRAASAQKP